MATTEEMNRRAATLTLAQIESLTDAEITALSMERPGHPGQRGSILTPSYFRSDSHLEETTYALMARLIKARSPQH
jgi:hypothetical protein